MRRSLMLALAILLGWPMLSSCQQSSECLVDAEEVKQANNDIVMLDVRTPQEFAQGHLDGAININVLQSDFTKEVEQLDKNKTYYVYCRSGRRSANAQKMMKNIGFQEVCNVKGGVLRLGANGVELVKP